MICTSASVVIDQRLKGEYNEVTRRDYIVFDEADQLPDAAELQVSCEIGESQIKELGIEVESAKQAATEILKKRNLEPEVKAAALMILEAIDEPAWFYKAGITDDGGIKLHHKMPGRLLKRIANRNEVAFISATLSINGSFDDFKRSLGIQNQSHLSTIVEPIKHGNLHFSVAAVGVDTPEWFDSIKRTVEQAKEKVLVVTPSHELAAQLGKMIPGSTVRESTETANQAIVHMGNSKVLIAAGVWAGLDTPIQWESIVVPRIPYERPVNLDGHIESSFLDSRNTAIRRMRQVIGRGLRSPQAECTIYILDDRYKKIESFIPKRFNRDWREKKLLMVFLKGGGAM